MLYLWQKIVETTYNIWVGYTNLIKYKLGLFQKEDTKEYERKKSFCTKDCPLQSKVLGIKYCDFSKRHEGITGCGCVIEAKLWSDSDCPINRF